MFDAASHVPGPWDRPRAPGGPPSRSMVKLNDIIARVRDYHPQADFDRANDALDLVVV